MFGGSPKTLWRMSAATFLSENANNHRTREQMFNKSLNHFLK